ncbi:MAG: O-antigen ligase family protein [Eubacterium sp.]|nr:O-antigen ligase family protein [Eubacterium sp.]
MEKVKFNFNILKDPAALIICIGAFCVGLFNEFVCAAFGIAVAALLLVKAAKQKKLSIGLNLALISVCAVSFGFLVTALWGVDKYYSLLGFTKFLPLVLFYVYVTQKDENEALKSLDLVPLAGAVMTVLSGVLSLAVKNKELFLVKGRLSGFFQYPSTFALFLIIGIIVLSNQKLSVPNGIIGAVLIAGVFLSGSRTSFIVLALVVLALVFTAQNKAFRRFALIAFVLVLVGAVVYSLVDSDSPVARFLKISLSSVTLKGRLLYFKDALRQIAKRPFGLGYMGYYFSQGSFQTGVYANRYVHNELLQLLLDIGWVPALLCVAWVGTALFNKNKPLYVKLIIAAAALHSMMDFDLQYLAIDFILLVCLASDKNKREVGVKKSALAAVVTVFAAVTVFSAYLGASSFLFLINKSDSAVKICKYNTMAQIDALAATDDLDEKLEIANTIIKNDKYITNAYSAKAQYYYDDGDIQKTIEQKLLALKYNRYSHDEYEDLCGVLLAIIPEYIEMGDYDSAQYCIDKLAALQKSQKKLKNSTDKIAYDLPEKPDFTLPDEYKEAIEYYTSL